VAFAAGVLELAERAVVVVERLVRRDLGRDAVALEHLRGVALERAVADRELVDGRTLERQLVLGVGVEIGVAPLLEQSARADLDEDLGEVEPRATEVLSATDGFDPLGIA